MLRLPFRPPFDAEGLLQFFAARAVAGVETLGDDGYVRTLRLPHGAATVALQLPTRRGPHAHVTATLRLADPRDLGPAVARVRRLLDLDADPVAVDELLGADPALATAVEEVPGIRLPGSVDGAETAIRTLLGQQVSVAAARTAAARLAEALGERLPPALAVAGRRAAVPDARGDRRARRGGPDRACPADRERAAPSPRRSPTARSRSTPGATPRTCAPSWSRCPASGRGPRATSRCACSATPTSCWPKTSACGAAPPPSACRPTSPA